MEVIINEIDTKKIGEKYQNEKISVHHITEKEPEEMAESVTIDPGLLRIFEATGKDDTRYWTRMVYIMAIGKSLVLQATDGHIAARFEVEMTERLKYKRPVYIDRDECRAIIRMAKQKKADIVLDFKTDQVRVDGCLAGEMSPVSHYIDVKKQYDMVARLFDGPRDLKPAEATLFNPVLLDRLRKAFDLKKGQGFKLEFSGPLSPIRVSGPEQGMQALLMPMRGL